jgi:4-hydroxyphenylpyruvate dioxygenase-like putative hemolysin/rRNA maturation protein Nop10
MKKLICPKCKKVHLHSIDDKCPVCGGTDYKDFSNSDEYLRKEIEVVLEERQKLGLDGLVNGLNNIVINTEPDRQKAAVEEFLKFTGLNVAEAFEDSDFRTVVLKTEGSGDFLIRSRKTENPFLSMNQFPKSGHVPNTRLEAFVFETTDIEKYVSIQKQRGIEFLTDDIIDADNYSFIQSVPSVYTGNSIGIIQWHRNEGKYASSDSAPLDWQFRKTDGSATKNIKELDHAATRVRAEDRDAAVIEFMNLTNYNFDFAIYVKVFNSITNVARFSSRDFAMVFTSGISPYVDDEKSGPTEKFVHNYGPRVHHMAFRTEEIEGTVSALKNSGMSFLIDLVGSAPEGLKQIFSCPSENTLLVNEYIHRYGDFDGFFTKSNVILLTGATDKQ